MKPLPELFMAAKQAYSSWAVKYISPMRKQYRKRINPLLGIAGFVCFFLLILSAGSTTEIKGNPPSQIVFKVLNSFPHDPTAFTQGFAYRDGFLYESTGLYGESSLRRTNPATGEVTAKINLSPKFFGEGLTILGDSIYQLTWKSGQGFIYDRKTLGRKGSFTYSTEGWGLTDDGTSLIMSDGTEKLYFLSPRNFKVTKVLRVREGGSPVRMLNELEYAGGKIYCNIWRSDDIVAVNPETGVVERRISLGELRKRLSLPERAEALNGIAWKSASDTFLVTGKRWSEVFEIEIGPGSP